MDKTWFQLKDVRKRRLADAVWIPLRISEKIQHKGTYGYVGYVDEFSGLGSVAFPTKRRGDVEKLSWSDVGIGHGQRVWATTDHYKSAETYQYNDREDWGVDLVLVQSFETDDRSQWHLNQDVVFALGLLREDDNWVRPVENYCVVARLRRGIDGAPIAIEIKNEFLRDYLCARNMFLRTSLYRQRDMIVEDAAEVGSPEEEAVDTDSERFELRVIPIIEGGHLGDGSYAVLRVGRTDVDPEEDVPQLGAESNENTFSESWQGKHEGRPLVRITGELWRDENIEPAKASPRVRGDEISTGIRYFTDASGEQLSSEELDDEDAARWLWFRPEVIPALCKHRGGRMRWYTQETGGVSCSTGYLTHFGLNAVGLVTVYAYDVAKLPTWQQRIWAGYNVVPEGKVSRELLSAQMETRVAETKAPEAALPEVLEWLDKTFTAEIGGPLFRTHSATGELILSISRFRALDPNGLFALAKDLMRLIADRIDVAALQRACPPPAGEQWRSIKSLEKYLATIIPAEAARKATEPLSGAYDLRLADAHLPAGELADAYKRARVKSSAPALVQGFWLIASVVSALVRIAKVVSKARETRTPAER